MRVLFLSLSVLCSSHFAFADTTNPSITPEVKTEINTPSPSNEVTLLFAGDAMQHAAQFKSAYNPKTKQYEYDDNFIHLNPIIEKADIAVVNLETTLGGKPYKSFPQFSSPDNFAKQLQQSGFDIVMLANNHSNDSWQRGVNRTIDVLDEIEFAHAGTYKSKEEHDSNTPLMIKKNGLNLAFLNYTFATNGIASVFDEQTKRISFNQMRIDIRKAKAKKADSIIVYIHWGDEYKTQISQYQKDVANFLIDSQVDLIIGSHPHVIQPMIWQKPAKKQHEYLIAYSLGNFISNQRDLQQTGGALLQVTLKKTKAKTNIQNAGYYLTFVNRAQLETKFQHQVLPARLFERQIDALQWDQYGMLLKYVVWANNFLNENNVNVPEFQYQNKKWVLNKAQSDPLEIEPTQDKGQEK